MIGKRTPSLPKYAALIFLPLMASVLPLLSYSKSLYVPPALEDWQSWVLDTEDKYRCPFLYNRAEYTCVWVSSTDMVADQRGLNFSINAQAFAPRWIDLPGNDRYWPASVFGESDRGRVSLPVRAMNGRPQVYLETGEHRIEGRIDWQRVPSNIPLPKNSGIVQLSLNGDAIKRPELDRSGNLWLRKQQQQRQKLAKNALKVQVFRLIHDANPAKLITRVILEVSGEPREILSGQFLLDGFVPLAFNSDLPARIDENKNLRMQVKTGRWQVELIARYNGPLAQISYTKKGEDWPANEIWAFQADRSLRVVDVQGPIAVDPSQTNMPMEWRNFPAYQVKADQALTLKQLHRGDPTPESDSLELKRNLYLDFDGSGFTSVDNISGQLKRSWRLDSQAEYELGSVKLSTQQQAGLPQLITESADGETEGVELRADNIQLLAVSRVAKRGSMPVTGWRHDFKFIGTQLHLPPGWSLFAATGVDKAVASWIERWNLWDIFLVLIIVVAVFRLYGPFAGSLAMMTLLFVYHRVNAPVFIWLNLVAVLALLTVTQGKLKRWLSVYQAFSFLVLVLILLPFSVDQLRSAVYPQLKKPSYSSSMFTSKKHVFRPEHKLAEPMQDAFVEEEMMAVEEDASRPSPRKSKLARMAGSSDRVQELSSQKYTDTSTDYDPKAIIQTGPGVPNWSWSSVNLQWNGPVTQAEMLRLYLVPPWLNRIGNTVAVLLAFLFASLLALRSRQHMSFSSPTTEGPGGDVKTAGVTASVILLVCFSVVLPNNSHADVSIDKDLLKELEQRLKRNAKCLPHCVGVQKARVTAKDNTLDISMTIDAHDAIAAPLPAWRNSWSPARVSVDGRPAVLWYANTGQLHVYLSKGSHRIQMEGSLTSNDIELMFGLPVHNFSFSLQGWELSGVRDGFVQTGAIQLNRIERRGPSENVLMPDPIPPFVTVTRRLELGLEWKMTTIVSRIAPRKGAITFNIPLVDGESPLTDFARKDDSLTVTFGSNQQKVSWQSNINVQEKVIFKSPEHHRWAEIWSVQVSPIWHASFEGIPTIKKDHNSLHSPLWMPWPGEKLIVTVARPPAVEGVSLTVDAVDYLLSVGQRIRESTLILDIRTSRGQNYAFELPDGAVLDALTVNNVSQPLIKTEGLIEIPLRPGQQNARLTWHQDRGVDVKTSIPKLALGDNVSNINLKINLPRDRWPLLVGGPLLGPAVLFWGVVLVVILGAFILSRSDLTPLKFHHWLLLGLGVCSTNLYGSLIMVAWLFGIGLKGRYAREISDRYYKLLQITLIFLTLAAILALVFAISIGLLSTPDMHIVGNGSDSFFYRWYQDRIDDSTPNAWVISVPILTYRIVMLVWSLWLSIVLLNWLRWVWQQLNVTGLWHRE